MKRVSLMGDQCFAKKIDARTLCDKRIVRFRPYNALEFLALLSLQVPLKGTYLVRYYGHYASRSRYLRSKQKTPAHHAPSASPTKKERRRRWATLMSQVFEVNPLQCVCGKEMKIVALVIRAGEIEAILNAANIALEEESARSPPAWFMAREAKEWIQQNQDLYPLEQDLSQPGPTLEDYHLDPVDAD